MGSAEAFLEVAERLVAGEERSMDCPKCTGTRLQQKQVKETAVQLDVCPSCRGIWFNANELNGLLPVASKDLRPPASAKSTALECPECVAAKLQAFHYPQTYVEIDMCGNCLGLWLYQHELKEIKVVREHRQQQGELEEYAPVVGFKGNLIRWIDTAIAVLLTFNEEEEEDDFDDY